MNDIFYPFTIKNFNLCKNKNEKNKMKRNTITERRYLGNKNNNINIYNNNINMYYNNNNISSLNKVQCNMSNSKGVYISEESNNNCPSKEYIKK